MINAKAETVAEKPAYRAAFKARPCLVPADGFYEWAKRASGAKQPYFFTTKDRAPFAFAGLWEAWHAKDAVPLETFTILTTAPNALCAPIHDRMPVMLSREDWDLWLGSVEQRAALLGVNIPGGADDMLAGGDGGGNVKNEGAKLVERVLAI